MIESEGYDQLKEIIKNDYPTYSGLTLEMYFRKKMMEEKSFKQIGSWWQAKKGKDACEIDLIGIYTDDKRALVAEVKRQRKNFKPDAFNEKAETLRKKVLSNYELEIKDFSMDDM